MIKFALITSCSHTRTMDPVAEVAKLPTGLTMATALQKWLEMLQQSTVLITPGELYRGLGFSTLTKIKEEFHPDSVYVVTGGQGLISLDENIAPYDFSADKKEPHNIHQKVTNEPFVQTVWWKMINQARKQTPTPIADLVKGYQGDLVLISCSKIFLRYISDDILSIPPNLWSKVRILLSASSIGGVPAQLRPFLVPFDRSAISHMPGNRNDNNHRAAQKFLELVEHEEGFATLVNTKQADYLSTEAEAGPAHRVEQILKDHPELLKQHPDEAYHKVRRMYGTVGGRLFFRSVHRSLSGAEITVESGDVDQASDILQSMNLSSYSGPSLVGEDVVLQHLKLFVEACKRLPKPPTFTAVDVVAWAERYFAMKNLQVPDILSSPNKLTFTLKNNAALLGLVESGTGGGTKAYTLEMQPQE